MRRQGWTAAGAGAGLAALLLAVPAGVPAGAEGAGAVRTAAACPAVTWGSTPELGRAAARPGRTVTGVRSGRHACFDRLVVDLTSSAPAFLVRYVDRVTEDGSGRVIPTRGGARLQVTVFAPAYDAGGHLTYVPANQRELTAVAGYRTFRHVVWAGTFEGYTNLGLGVRARLPFRVLQVAGPGTGSRLVVDVAHTW